MKLSDFGLCKPLDCSNLAAINQHRAVNYERLKESMDVDESCPNYEHVKHWKSSLEQCWQYQKNGTLAFYMVGTLCSIALEVLLKK